MAKRKRKSDSVSFFGIVLLEVIALTTFFFLFTNARAERKASFERDRLPELVENAQATVHNASQRNVESYQMFEASPLQDLLAQQPASYQSNSSLHGAYYGRH